MNNPILSEKDLELLFAGKKKPKTKTPLFKGLFFVISFFIISAFVFIVINFRTLGQNFSFWYNNEYKISPQSLEVQNLAAISSNKSNTSLPEIDNNSLNFPIINVKAPITWGVANNPNEVALGLSKGIIQVNGTALPGETGNVFITGHSSNYPWAKGKYNNVFALLNRVVVGDVAEVKYQNVSYLYKVREIKTVDPSNISVMTSKKESVLTLMTCTPVGTSLRRLIVVADQVYPNPNKNKPMQDQDVGSVLPPVH